MSWNYANLTKTAKAAGGPEKLVETIARENMKRGRNSMIPWVGIAVFVSSAATAGVCKAVDHFRKKREASQKALEDAKEELIWGIRGYEASRPELAEEISEG